MQQGVFVLHQTEVQLIGRRKSVRYDMNTSTNLDLEKSFQILFFVSRLGFFKCPSIQSDLTRRVSQPSHFWVFWPAVRRRINRPDRLGV